MASDKLLRLVSDCLDPITPLLYQDTATALINSESRVGDLVRRGHLHLRSLTVRAEVRAQLEDQALGDWVVGGDPHLMGQLYLRHPLTGVTLRMLKERRRTFPGGVPPAGHNRARRQYWSQPVVTGLVVPDQPITREVTDDIKLLLLWDLTKPGDLDAGFSLRVVKTLGPGKFGSAVPIDFSLPLTAQGGAWASLEFPSDDDYQDFFQIDTEEESDDGEATAL